MAITLPVPSLCSKQGIAPPLYKGHENSSSPAYRIIVCVFRPDFLADIQDFTCGDEAKKLDFSGCYRTIGYSMSSSHPSAVPDTGVVTLWFSCNYGAILTTFALYRLLEQEGRHPVLLDQSPLIHIDHWYEEQSISRAFMRAHGLKCSEPLHCDADIQRLNEEVHTFIVGSDQVWRWQYTQAYGLLHFLDFVSGEKRKIAFSSSFGIDKEERPVDSARKAGYYLRSFDAVSVREKSGVEILKQHYDVEADWVPDPVLLCGTQCYEGILTDTTIPHKPYLLSYVLEPDTVIRHHIETIAAEKGLDVINLVDAQKDMEQQRERYHGIGHIEYGVTPEQWLAYIRGCAYFVTDSFHGVCFAHIYHRPFLCVAPQERGLTRFTSLLELTGLSRCLLPAEYSEEEWQAAMAPIHWEQVQMRLDAAIAQGRSWLHAALTSPRDKRTQDLAQAVYELVYAGDGAAERNRAAEADLRQRLHHYQTVRLPRELRLKMGLLRLFTFFPIPVIRGALRHRLQILTRLSRYLHHSPNKALRQAGDPPLCQARKSH